MLSVLLVSCAVVGVLALVVLAVSAALVAVKVRHACDRIVGSAARISGAVSVARELAERAASRSDAEVGAGRASPSWADLMNGRGRGPR